MFLSLHPYITADKRVASQMGPVYGQYSLLVSDAELSAGGAALVTKAIAHATATLGVKQGAPTVVVVGRDGGDGDKCPTVKFV